MILRTLADVEAFESVPLEERIDAWTVYDLLKRGAAFDPARHALLYLETADAGQTPSSVSFAELLAQVERAVALFAALGEGSRPVVAVMLPSLPQHYVCLLAAPTAGILCPLNWTASPASLAGIVRDVGAGVLVTMGPAPGFDTWEKAQELIALAPGIRHVLQIRGPRGDVDPALDFERRIAERPTGLAMGTRPSRRDVAIYSATGGTTGAPKIVQLTHEGIAYACFAYGWFLGHGPGDTMLAGTPLFHAGGIVARTLNPLAHGVTNLVLTPTGFGNRQVLENLWALVERHGVTELNLVPTVVARLLGRRPPAGALAKVKRHGTSGSAELLPGLAERFERHTGITILSNYSLTECSTIVTVSPITDRPRFGASGIRLPYTRLRIAALREGEPAHGGAAAYGGAAAQGRPAARDCPPGETGLILAKGPGTIPGYLNSELDADLFVDDGWVNTGDVGYLDADGYLWVTGRAKDLIIRGGHNVDPRIIEEALMAHEAVELAAAVGKPNLDAGEVPVAYVQLRAEATATADEVRAFANTRIPEPAARLCEVYVLDAMPLTEVGKLAKSRLRRDAARRAFEDALLPVAQRGGLLSVEVSEDPVHGFMPHVQLAECDERAALEALAREILGTRAKHYRIS